MKLIKKYYFIIGLFLSILLSFSSYIYRVNATEAPVDSNLLPDKSKSCIQVTGNRITGNYAGDARNETQLGPGEWGVTLTGECLSSEPCDIATCYIPVIVTGFDEHNRRIYGKDPDPLHIKCAVTTSGLTEAQMIEKTIAYYGAGAKSNVKIVQIPKVILKSGKTSLPPGPFKEEAVVKVKIVEQVDEERPQDGMHTISSFFAWGNGKISQKNLGKGNDSVTPIQGEKKTQQLGQVEFQEEAPAVVGTAGEQKKCSQIYWDPYGIVFDNVSLEPLNSAMAIVSLLDSAGKPVESTIPTEVPIDMLGKYNIYVEKDGFYKLGLTSESHSFVDIQPAVNYKYLYDTIFLPNDPAFEEKKGAPKRMDIPVKSKTTPFVRKLEEYIRIQTDVLLHNLLYTSLEIRVTHPLSIVHVFTGEKEITPKDADYLFNPTTDKNGVWVGLIKKSLISNTGLTVEVTKNNKYFIYNTLNTNEKLIIKFNPILNYVEGYAYDENSRILPNAKVRVRLSMNDTIIYETVADDSGFFTIYPKNLSSLEYYFEYVNPVTQKVQKLSTLDFVIANQVYLNSKKIDLIKVKKNGKSIVGPISGTVRIVEPFTQGQRDSFSNQSQNNISNENNESLAKKNSIKLNNFYLNKIFFILFFLIILLVSVIFYIKKRNSKI